jgi:hypothetical protein
MAKVQEKQVELQRPTVLFRMPYSIAIPNGPRYKTYDTAEAVAIAERHEIHSFRRLEMFFPALREFGFADGMVHGEIRTSDPRVVDLLVKFPGPLTCDAAEVAAFWEFEKAHPSQNLKSIPVFPDFAMMSVPDLCHWAGDNHDIYLDNRKQKDELVQILRRKLHAKGVL